MPKKILYNLFAHWFTKTLALQGLSLRIPKRFMLLLEAQSHFEYFGYGVSNCDSLTFDASCLYFASKVQRNLHVLLDSKRVAHKLCAWWCTTYRKFPVIVSNFRRVLRCHQNGIFFDDQQFVATVLAKVQHITFLWSTTRGVSVPWAAMITNCVFWFKSRLVGYSGCLIVACKSLWQINLSLAQAHYTYHHIGKDVGLSRTDFHVVSAQL